MKIKRDNLSFKPARRTKRAKAPERKSGGLSQAFARSQKDSFERFVDDLTLDQAVSSSRSTEGLSFAAGFRQLLLQGAINDFGVDLLDEDAPAHIPSPTIREILSPIKPDILADELLALIPEIDPSMPRIRISNSFAEQALNPESHPRYNMSPPHEVKVTIKTGAGTASLNKNAMPKFQRAGFNSDAEY